MTDMFRERLAEGREHLTISGTFQSDKYPTVPAGKVPLSVDDPQAQPLLWEYAQAHRAANKHGDTEFSRDLEDALLNAGYEPESAWIDVHDAVPKKGQMCLVTYRSGKARRSCHLAFWTGKRWSFIDSHLSRRSDRVTGWIAVPPYHKRTNDGQSFKGEQ